MDKLDCKELWKNIKINSNNLHGCDLHSFIEMEDGDITIIGENYKKRKVDKKYKCLHCNGQIGSKEKLWYDIGFDMGINKEAK